MFVESVKKSTPDKIMHVVVREKEVNYVNKSFESNFSAKN